MKLDWLNIVKSPYLWGGILAFVLLLLLAFWMGTRQGREWADSQYLQDRDERMKVIAVHEANEKKLAAENEMLKLENEAKAEILKQTDSANDAKKAEEFRKLQDERKRKSDEIENASPGESLVGLCDDAKRAGYSLSICR